MVDRRDSAEARHFSEAVPSELLSSYRQASLDSGRNGSHARDPQTPLIVLRVINGVNNRRGSFAALVFPTFS